MADGEFDLRSIPSTVRGINLYRHLLALSHCCYLLRLGQVLLVRVTCIYSYTNVVVETELVILHCDSYLPHQLAYMYQEEVGREFLIRSYFP